MRDEINKYLKRAGADGNIYQRMAATVLSRDKNWVRWKMESCPSIIRDAVSAAQYLDAMQGARRATANRRIKANPTGTLNLNFLSEAGNVTGLDSLKDPARFSSPSIDDLVKGIGMDELDMEMAAGEELEILKARKDNKTWRAVRAATRSCLAKLEGIKPGESLQDIFKPGGSSSPRDDAQEDEIPGLVEANTPAVEIA